MAGLLSLLVLASTSSLVALENNISGDDCDPAAAGMPELSVAALPGLSAPAVGTSHSGDDDYGVAAGGAAELSLLAFSADVSLAETCSLSEEEVAA